MFCIYLRTNSDLCHLQHKLIGFYSRFEKCLQRGMDWVFNWSILRFIFKGLNRSVVWDHARRNVTGELNALWDISHIWNWPQRLMSKWLNSLRSVTELTTHYMAGNIVVNWKPYTHYTVNGNSTTLVTFPITNYQHNFWNSGKTKNIELNHSSSCNSWNRKYWSWPQYPMQNPVWKMLQGFTITHATPGMGSI